MKTAVRETLMRAVFFAAAFVSVAAVVLICVFLFFNGIPGMVKIGTWDFLSGTTWRPDDNIYGIFPMILGSIYVTAVALVIGVPSGIMCAVYMARFFPPVLYRFFKPAVVLLAGIPSVVYGFFGLMVIVPAVRSAFGGSGKSILAAGIVLGMMILPTVISVSETSVRAVPESYYEGSLALGATRERSVFSVVVPAAGSGILSSVVLGMGRAVGETMAVYMVAGNQPVIPESIVKGVRTLTTNIVVEMGEAADLHREALIATGVVLFVFIMLINLLFSFLKRRALK